MLRFFEHPRPDLFSTLHFLNSRLPPRLPYKPYRRATNRHTGYEQVYTRITNGRIEAAIWRGYNLQNLPTDLRIKMHKLPGRRQP
jgi:hypothetical protein